MDAPGLPGGQLIHQLAPGGWGLDHQLVHAGRVPASVNLRNPPDTENDVGVAAQHELLQRADLLEVVRLARPEDASSQVANDPVRLAPLERVPVGAVPSPGSVCRPRGPHRTCPGVGVHHNVLWVTHQAHVSRLSPRASPPYPPGYVFPAPFGWRRSLLGPSWTRCGFGPSFRRSSGLPAG